MPFKRFVIRFGGPMSLISEFRRQRQKEFQASFNYILSLRPAGLLENLSQKQTNEKPRQDPLSSLTLVLALASLKCSVILLPLPPTKSRLKELSSAVKRIAHILHVVTPLKTGKCRSLAHRQCCWQIQNKKVERKRSKFNVFVCSQKNFRFIKTPDCNLQFCYT